jgi:hypothetical protein
VRRLTVVAASMLALAIAATAAARDPRAEKERLKSTDMHAARAALVRLTDLQSGFQQTKTPPSNSPLSCPGWKPDFSHYTITGKAEADYQHPAGAFVMSEAEVYATHADATGDFHTGARPQFAKCLQYALQQQATSGVVITVQSSKMVAAPHVGERAARFKAVATFRTAANTLDVYMDIVAFQQGRLLGAVMTMAVGRPLGDGTTLASRMVSRFN